MMPLAIQLSILWSLLLLGAFWLISAPTFQFPAMSRRAAILLTISIALFVRLFANWLLPVGAIYDIESYQIIGDLVLANTDVYTSDRAIFRYPYLPLQMYWSASALWLSNASGITFVTIVRVLPIIADVAIVGVLLFATPVLPSFAQRFRAAFIYALNPIPVFVAAYHGQFDALPVVLLLIAALWLYTSPTLSGLALGAGILAKSWPVLGLPVLLANLHAWRSRITLLLGTLLVPLIGIIIYAWLFQADPVRVVQTAMGYNRGIGIWGYTYAFRLGQDVTGNKALMHWIIANGRWFTLGALAVVWWMRARHETPVAGVLTILVCFFACTHAFAIQYLVWPVAFALLANDMCWLRRYTLAAYLYMVAAYSMLILDATIIGMLPQPFGDHLIIILGLPAWLVFVAWLKARWQNQPVPATLS
ncbi:hypothetical protein A6A03_07875 [Chloroflexus islandicus]|uniref:DUF2029 domain-containing protein n=1 Tax=Chloroflexus islandicus TaxID=1707952 RepID=A0A178MIF1_9CHLR|nr:glycosyltransferase 87 family protein [Chloroflexus islandicus]OAN48491.1 hypothetical protein A6A03_07875 [Chloroflexus islandicus]